MLLLCLCLLSLFFFFKQKTAYEMRISDWSSDVCSSDLMTVLDTLLVGVSTPRARSRRGQNLERVFQLFPKLNERRSQLCGTLSGGEQQMEIGRASCRERVCQYV